ncbi:MAG TPA: type IX secretion system protein PorQ [Cytophagales bacterium]|nr:type IX secretion system protein PorQ [Cytophagales bacterium]
MFKRCSYSFSIYFPKKGVGAIFFFIVIFSARSQDVYTNSYEFLNIPPSARQVGLGGKNVTSADRDPNGFLSNPAVLNKQLDNFISFNYIPYFAKVNYLSTSFAKDFNKFGSWGASINYLDYGTFKGFDPSGESIGQYSARDYALVISNSQTKENFSFGGSIKLAGSDIAGYFSSALLFDIGGLFVHPSKDLKIGMTIKNVGLSLRNYTNSSDFKMPFDVQIGGSFKPEHMPVRLSMTLHSLNRFKVSEELNGEKVSTTDQIFRHLVIGTEVLLTKNINIRAGYDHQRRKEMKLSQGGALSGFSIGMMIRVKAFEVAYSRGGFNAAGSQNCFTLITNLNYFLNKNK